MEASLGGHLKSIMARPAIGIRNKSYYIISNKCEIFTLDSNKYQENMGMKVEEALSTAEESHIISNVIVTIRYFERPPSRHNYFQK